MSIAGLFTVPPKTALCTKPAPGVNTLPGVAEVPMNRPTTNARYGTRPIGPASGTKLLPVVSPAMLVATAPGQFVMLNAAARIQIV
jgi:hypothetical protein